MNLDWTNDDSEALAREELGPKLVAAADLFPRLVVATYVQMTSPKLPDGTVFNRDEYQKAIINNMPKNIEETLPFFVRTVWNRKFNFRTDTCEIEKLADEFSSLISECGGRVSTEELVDGCRASFDEPSGIRN
jgi:hypothetical protein